MSRVGKKIITLPAGVKVVVRDRLVEVTGPKGSLHFEHVPQVAVTVDDSTVSISPVATDDKRLNALWGLTRAMVANMIVGVSQGFTKVLEMTGVGFKVALQGKKLVLNVGFSHPVEYVLPEGIEGKVEKNVITVSGINKQLVGQVTAEIRGIKPPEPYKGKGIKYSTEVIRRKVGKVVKSAG